MRERAAEILSPESHGDFSRWRDAVRSLPDISPSSSNLRQGTPCIGSAGELPGPAGDYRGALMELHPWRKGPLEWFGIRIETEWRSDWKWARIAPHLASLDGRRILDVGSGNGYYLLRMAGEGARLAIGIEPVPLFVMQFQVFRRYLPELPAHILPFFFENLPAAPVFDTVFSLGVLSHRRSPIDHLYQLKDFLRPDGELVLETLVIQGNRGDILVPEDRYARMRNVWFLPSPEELAVWLRRVGYDNIRIIDVTPTTTEEQRSTEWMRFQSLAESLDPSDCSKTVEGLPAPVRAVLIARKPE